MPQSLLTDEQRLDWLRLLKSENVGPATFKTLLNRFGGARSALEALPELSKRGGLKRPIKIYPREAAERDFENTARVGASWIALGEPDYPGLLRHTDGAPPLVCAKGKPEVLRERAVAIVGSRNASAAGRNFTRTLARELGEAGFVPASGLARGIDTVAHEASIDTGTIAVLAGGIDVIYPPENDRLYQAICEAGVVITEMTPGTRPQARHFPRRNRIISGVSLGTVVVEAALRSGSLITARLAGEQSREVFAVPGSPLDPRAAGTNRLLRDGATIVTSSQDIIDVVNSLSAMPSDTPDFFAQEPEDDLFDSHDPPPDASDREVVAALLGPSPVSIDDLVRESGLTAAIVRVVLLELELAGKIEVQPGQRVALTGG